MYLFLYCCCYYKVIRSSDTWCAQFGSVLVLKSEAQRTLKHVAIKATGSSRYRLEQ